MLRFKFVSALVCVCAAGAAPGNLAPNPKFELMENGQPLGYRPGTVKGKMQFRVAGDAARGQCLQIQSDEEDAKGNWTTTPAVRVVPGDEVKVTVDMKLEDVDPGHGGSGAVLAFHFYRDGRYLSFGRSVGRIGTHDWAELSHTVRVPKDANEMSVSMRLSEAKGTLWFDDLRIVGKPGKASERKPAEVVAGARGKVALFQQRSHKDFDTVIGHFHHEKYAVDHFHRENIKSFPVEMAKLKQYAAVIYSSLAVEGGVKLLSDAQQEAIVRYVAEGGGLCTVVGELPGSRLSDLLPLCDLKSAKGYHFIPVAAMPEHPILRDLPSRWPGFGSRYNAYSAAKLKPGAKAIMTVPEAVAPKNTPFLTVGQFGRGRVVCMNSLWCYGTGAEFKWWRYAPRFFAQCTRWAGGLAPLAADEKIPPPEWDAVAGGGSFWAAGSDLPALPKRLRETLRAKPTPPTKAAAITIDPGEPYPTRIVTPGAAPKVEDLGERLRIVLSNGFRIDFAKSGAIAVTTDKGLPLTPADANGQPVIAASGTEPLQLLKNVDAETINEQAAIPKRRALAKTLTCASHRVDGSAVIVRCSITTTDGGSATLDWRLVPRSVSINGREWKGFGHSFQLVDEQHYIESIVDRTPWRIGPTLDGHRTMRSACYSSPRGYHEVVFRAGEKGHTGKWSYFSSGQPFQVVGSSDGTLFTYLETPTTVMGWTETTPDRKALFVIHQIKVGRQRGEICTPIEWRLFCEDQLDADMWMELGDHVRDTYCERYGIRPARPKPSAMCRFDTIGQTGYIGINARIKPFDCRQMADVFLSPAARCGVKRIDIGHVIGYEISPAAFERNGGKEGLKYLVEKCHSLDMEAYWYLRIAIYNAHLKLMGDHPDWIVKNKDGSNYQGAFAGMNVLSMKSGWFDYSLDVYRQWKRDYDMDGVWFDTVGFAFDPFNYAEEQCRSMVPYGIRYQKAFQDLGYGYWVEGQSPFGLDSFWYRKRKYQGDYAGHEFALCNSSPWTYGPDGAFFLDLFKLASYHCCPVIDVRLMLDADAPLAKRIAECNRKFDRVVELIGHPRKVKQTEFGTMWIGERGYALFAHEGRVVSVRGVPGTAASEVVGNGSVRPEDGRVVVELWKEDVCVIPTR